MEIEEKAKIFYQRLKTETKFAGMPCPFDVVEFGNKLGLTETESNLIAKSLVRNGLAEYKAVGDSAIQLVF